MTRQRRDSRQVAQDLLDGANRRVERLEAKRDRISDELVRAQREYETAKTAARYLAANPLLALEQ